MHIFLTGGSGFIGSATTTELLSAGHVVTALARSDAAAATIESRGAQVVRGSLDDLDLLRSVAAESEAVVHLAFKHDIAFTGDYAGAAEADRLAIEALGSSIGGNDPALVIASGLAGLSFGRPTTEDDMPVRDGAASARIAGFEATLALAGLGVRSSAVRLAPTVHGEGDGRFVKSYADVAKDKGVVAYVGDGSNRWPAVHRTDAASLFRLAVEQAAPGSVLHGSAEEGIALKDIAEALGRQLDLPTASIAPDDAEAHFGWLDGFITMDVPASSALTRDRLGWNPTGPTLLEDIEAGHYTAS